MPYYQYHNYLKKKQQELNKQKNICTSNKIVEDGIEIEKITTEELKRLIQLSKGAGACLMNPFEDRWA